MPAKQCDPNTKPEQRPNDPPTVNRWFHRFACKTSDVVGSPWSFFIAIGTIVAWGVTGPIFHYSDTWQLIINTSTTIVTFLMVFLIQNTQNRDAKTFHLKLDELIHAIKGARNKMIDLENMTDEELERIRNEFQRLSRHREQQASHEHGPANGRKQQATR
jgi:low affinity Fe/Cu permease